jgi:hypothetical protein
MHAIGRGRDEQGVLKLSYSEFGAAGTPVDQVKMLKKN